MATLYSTVCNLQAQQGRNIHVLNIFQKPVILRLQNEVVYCKLIEVSLDLN